MAGKLGSISVSGVKMGEGQMDNRCFRGSSWGLWG